MTLTMMTAFVDPKNELQKIGMRFIHFQLAIRRWCWWWYHLESCKINRKQLLVKISQIVLLTLRVATKTNLICCHAGNIFETDF